MGTRYFLTLRCPACKHTEDDVYYAPTCGFVDWTCPKCGHVVDLAKYSGISYEDASNRKEIERVMAKASKEKPTLAEPEDSGHRKKEGEKSNERF